MVSSLLLKDATDSAFTTFAGRLIIYKYCDIGILHAYEDN